ncbi:MAG: ferrous iron transport protein A [Bacteroidia bacterium]|nr:ferrous iron transport protein A [Bacteroidia bacterium]
MRTLADLKPGESAHIVKFTDDILALKFIEMGCLPGEIIVFDHSAPLGCPLAYFVGGYKLSMRKTEARTIVVD